MVTLCSGSWQINNIETVLFDKDGTFIDLHYFWGKMTELRAQKIIKVFNLKENYFSKLCLFLGYDNISGKMLSDGITALYSRDKIIKIFKENLKEIGIVTTEVELTRVFDSVSKDFYEDMINYIKPIESAIEFIIKLKKAGVNIGIVTSDSVESTKLTINSFGWNTFFDVIIGRESSDMPKESGIPIKLAIEKLGAKTSTTIMIGDTPIDFISAHKAGIENSILVATGQTEKSTLIQTSSYVVENLNEVEIII